MLAGAWQDAFEAAANDADGTMMAFLLGFMRKYSPASG